MRTRPKPLADQSAGRDVLQVRNDERFGENPEKPVAPREMTIGELVVLSFGADHADCILRVHVLGLAEEIEACSALLYDPPNSSINPEQIGYRLHRLAMRALAARELASRIEAANCEMDDDVGNEQSEASE